MLGSRLPCSSFLLGFCVDPFFLTVCTILGVWDRWCFPQLVRLQADAGIGYSVNSFRELLDFWVQFGFVLM